MYCKIKFELKKNSTSRMLIARLRLQIYIVNNEIPSYSKRAFIYENKKIS